MLKWLIKEVVMPTFSVIDVGMIGVLIAALSVFGWAAIAIGVPVMFVAKILQLMTLAKVSK